MVCKTFCTSKIETSLFAQTIIPILNIYTVVSQLYAAPTDVLVGVV